MSVKRTILMLGTLAVLASVAGCNLPMSSSPEPLGMPTPNQTLTAIFNPPVVIPPTVTVAVPPTEQKAPTTAPTAVPTATQSQPIPTATAVIPTATNTAVLPTNTPIPTNMRSGPSASAQFLTTSPAIDGDWSDWDTKAYPAGFVVYGAANYTNDADLEASYRVAWDSDYLYVAVKVRDDNFVQGASGADLYKGDSIEILLDTNVQGDFFSQSLSDDDYQIGISPGRPDVGQNMEAVVWYPRSKAGTPSGVKIGAIQSEGVWRIEAAIPWSVIGVSPANGKHLGFAISASDNDKDDENVQQCMVSSVSTRTLTDPSTWGDLTLTK